MASPVLNNNQTSTSDSLSYTPSSVSDPVLVVCIFEEDAFGNDGAITAVDFGATAMTIAETGSCVVATHEQNVVIAYLANPGTSTETITVTGGESGRMGIFATTLSGADTSSPVDVTDGQDITELVNTITTSATTTVTDTTVISCVNHGQAGSSFTLTGGTEVADFDPTSQDAAVGQSAEASAGTYSHKWDIDSADVFRMGCASVAFKAAAAAGGRIMGSIAGQGGLSGMGGIAGQGGGIAG